MFTELPIIPSFICNITFAGPTLADPIAGANFRGIFFARPDTGICSVFTGTIVSHPVLITLTVATLAFAVVTAD